MQFLELRRKEIPLCGNSVARGSTSNTKSPIRNSKKGEYILWFKLSKFQRCSARSMGSSKNRKESGTRFPICSLCNVRTYGFGPWCFLVISMLTENCSGATLDKLKNKLLRSSALPREHLLTSKPLSPCQLGKASAAERDSPHKPCHRSITPSVGVSEKQPERSDVHSKEACGARS